ncbi:hypothetical protein [Leeuwenhoekiella nanhaiensis]|uniref:Uncharacterized protein n=1 Tax=Leeuwenhoekiella nanhaiensis TaxID=1655491 RepID=A0A2G1VM76_9FLAO|nr:hypothetical protein [Leeuwenhoekiella nanhaiensis]PHQ27875.1 hypothetical protein CJ305_17880 [Leeuwenhoekiella nanhaiensis]
MDSLKAIQLTKCINGLNEVLPVIPEEDLNQIISLLEKYTLKVKNYNKTELTVINPTKRELGSFSSSTIRIIRSKYKPDFIDQNKDKIDVLIKSTNFDEEIITAKILSSRRQPNYYRRDDLDKVLNEHLNLQIYQSFIDQNEEFFINNIKYLL